MLLSQNGKPGEKMLLMASIGPKKGRFEEKKILNFGFFLPPKWAKTSFWGPCCRGAKQGVPPLAPPKFFWSVHQNSSRNNISKIWEVIFPQFCVNPFSLFSSFYTCVYCPLVAVFVVLKNKFWETFDRGQPKFSFDTPNTDIRWLLDHGKVWYLLICSITSCKVISIR